MKLKFGMVGGGIGSGIGPVHHLGAVMDNKAELVAGCFSRNPEKNRETAELWSVRDNSRIYEDYLTMATEEGKRDDGIDFVIIATPNNTHYEIAKLFMEQGIHIVCDKPLALNVEQGLELATIANTNNILFCVTYTYAGYAMIRQARELVENGELGELVYVTAEYPQEWLAVGLIADKSDQAMWRLDPKQVGSSLCAADIGTHMEHLIVAATGLELKSVLAKYDTYPRHLPLETNTTIMLKYPNEVSGLIWASQVAIGHECDVRIRVYGSKASFEWYHGSAGLLKVTKINQPVQYYSANRDYDAHESTRLCRLPSGHPEGYFEAFGNIYRSFCEHLLALKDGREPDISYTYPNIHDGVVGLKFIRACNESNKNGNVWVDL